MITRKEENRFSSSGGGQPTTPCPSDETEDVNPKHNDNHNSPPLTSDIFSPTQLRERVKRRRALLAQKRLEDPPEVEHQNNTTEDENSHTTPPTPQPHLNDKDKASPQDPTKPETPSSPEHHPSSSLKPSPPTKRNESQDDVYISVNEEDARHTLIAYGECVSPEDGFAVSASSSDFGVILDNNNTPLPLDGNFGLGGRIQRPPVPSKKYYGLGSPVSKNTPPRNVSKQRIEVFMDLILIFFLLECRVHECCGTI